MDARPISHVFALEHLAPELTPMVLAQVAEVHWQLRTETKLSDHGHRLYIVHTDGANLPELVVHCELCRQVALVLFTPDPPLSI